jgi:hypothetical protein
MFTLYGQYRDNVFMKKTFTTRAAAEAACKEEWNKDSGLASYWVDPPEEASPQNNTALIDQLLGILTTNFKSWPYRCSLSTYEIKRLHDGLKELKV